MDFHLSLDNPSMRFDNKVQYQNLGGFYVFKETYNKLYLSHIDDRYINGMREINPYR